MPSLTFPVVPNGLFLSAVIGHDRSVMQALQAAGGPLPVPVSVRAAFDTGSDHTSVGPSLLASIGLMLAGSAQTRTASGVATVQYYSISLTLYDWRFQPDRSSSFRPGRWPTSPRICRTRTSTSAWTSSARSSFTSAAPTTGSRSPFERCFRPSSSRLDRSSTERCPRLIRRRYPIRHAQGPQVGSPCRPPAGPVRWDERGIPSFFRTAAIRPFPVLVC